MLQNRNKRTRYMSSFIRMQIYQLKQYVRYHVSMQMFREDSIAIH